MSRDHRLIKEVFNAGGRKIATRDLQYFRVDAENYVIRIIHTVEGNEYPWFVIDLERGEIESNPGALGRRGFSEIGIEKVSNAVRRYLHSQHKRDL